MTRATASRKKPLNHDARQPHGVLWRSALAALLLIAGVALLPPSASARTLAPEVEAEFNAIIDYNYRGSAVANPPTCGAVCQQLRNAELRAGTTAVGVELTTEANNLRAGSRLLPAFNFGSKALRISGPLGVAVLIGDVTGLNSKLVSLVFPQAGAGGASYCAGTCPQRVLFYPYANPNPDWNGPSFPLHQGGVFAWSWTANGGSSFLTRQVPDGPAGPACDGDPSPPGDFHVLSGPSKGLRCSATPVTSQAAYLLPSEVFYGPMTDYAGGPYDDRVNAPPDPGRSSVGADTRAKLESEEYPQLNAMLEFELGVDGACDPIDENVCNQDNAKQCDLSPGGNGADPLPSVSTSPFAPAQYEAFQAFQRAKSNGVGVTDTILRVGWTRPSPIATKGWLGWGYRHVAAKHGWQAADVAATQSALLNQPTVHDGGATLKYAGPLYLQQGVVCQRIVIVGPTKVKPGEPEPKEIITSYGGKFEL